MKHLKKFNESYEAEKRIEDICLELEDICLELKDACTKVDIDKANIFFLPYDSNIVSKALEYKDLYRCIYLDNRYFHSLLGWPELKDCLLRIKEYLYPLVKDVEFFYSFSIYMEYKKFDLNDNTEIEEIPLFIMIIFGIKEL